VCRDCHVLLGDRPLCGPCKAAFVRRLERGDLVSTFGRLPSPWESRRSLGSLAHTLALVLRHPSTFFRGLALDGPGYWSYLIAVGWPASILAGGVGYLVPTPFTDRSHPEITVGMVATAPVQLLLATVVQAALFHFFLRLVGGAPGRLETTVRATVYASSANVVQWIPLAGVFVAGAWGIVLQVVALKQMHDTTYTRVLLACVVIPGVLCLVGSFSLVWVLMVLRWVR
jgi:hypothetical protein